MVGRRERPAQWIFAATGTIQQPRGSFSRLDDGAGTDKPAAGIVRREIAGGSAEARLDEGPAGEGEKAMSTCIHVCRYCYKPLHVSWNACHAYSGGSRHMFHDACLVLYNDEMSHRLGDAARERNWREANPEPRVHFRDLTAEGRRLVGYPACRTNWLAIPDAGRYFVNRTKLAEILDWQTRFQQVRAGEERDDDTSE